MTQPQLDNLVRIGQLKPASRHSLHGQSSAFSPRIGDSNQRQIGRAAMQIRCPIEQPDRAILGQALRSPPEPLVLAQQRHLPASPEPGTPPFPWDRS